MTPNDLVFSAGRVRFMGRHFPASCGRGGITANKREGDGATPRGTHTIIHLFYRPDRITAPAAHAIPIGLNDLWCDDSSNPDYNHLVQRPFSASHEVMRRSDPQYDLVLTTNWNWPDTKPDLGSAIFIHQLRRPGAPTAGCIAFKRSHLHWIAKNLTPDSRLIVR